MNYKSAKKYVRALATVRYVEERPFMIAIVELTTDKRTMVTKGLSTCSITDHWNTKMGQDVARGRAEAKLARRVMRAMTKRAAELGPATLIDTDTVVGSISYDISYEMV